MAMPNAADAAAKWATNFGSSGTRWAAGVQAVTVAPGQLAARQKQLWITNTTAAADRFAANSAAVSLQQWQQMTVDKGQGRLASGAQAAQSKLEAVFAKLFPYIREFIGGPCTRRNPIFETGNGIQSLDAPCGLSRAPFTWRNGESGSEREMEADQVEFGAAHRPPRPAAGPVLVAGRDQPEMCDLTQRNQL